MIPVSEVVTCQTCPRRIAGTFLLGILCWIASAFAAVSISMIPYDFDESICGVWGCFPPILALVSVHSLWLIALTGGVWTLQRILPGSVRPVGIAMVILASVGIAFLLGNDLPSWIAQTANYPEAFWFKRVAYLLATETGIPCVQSLVVGLWAIHKGRRLAKERAASNGTE